MFMPDEAVTVIYREDSDRNRYICYEAENMEGHSMTILMEE